MDQRTRKLMMLYKALHPRDNVDRLYVSGKEGGRRLAIIEYIVDTSIQRLEDYTEKRGGKLITATRNNTDNTRTNRTTITRKQKWEEKQLYGHFKRLTSDISNEENVDEAKKWKPWKRNWISSNGSSKQRHTDQSYQSKNT